MASNPSAATWSDRFEQGLHPAIERFNASIGFDLALLEQDLDGSVAHARMLGRCGVITEAEASQLIDGLEQVRAEAIAADPEAWLALHRFYPGVVERLRRFASEGADWAVLTTKGAAFARQLLVAAQLEPVALYGHEQGSKSEVLAQLLTEPAQQHRPIWFVEDRRPTLELVRRQPDLAAVRCFLVSWGYLAPGDGEQLPQGIAWLDPASFAAPLAQWP
mgnify:CR=1 FL=1